LVIENRKLRCKLQIRNYKLQIWANFWTALPSERDLAVAKLGLRSLRFERGLAPESRAWSHWKPGGAIAKSQI